MTSRVAQIAGHLKKTGLLAGQVAIITGGAQGIGAECARLFASEGAKVVISDIDASKSDEVAKNIKENGGEALAVAGDLLKESYIEELVKNAAGFGNGKIHIIVNNAGYTWDGVIHKVRMSKERESLWPLVLEGGDCTLALTTSSTHFCLPSSR